MRFRGTRLRHVALWGGFGAICASGAHWLVQILVPASGLTTAIMTELMVAAPVARRLRAPGVGRYAPIGLGCALSLIVLALDPWSGGWIGPARFVVVAIGGIGGCLAIVLLTRGGDGALARSGVWPVAGVAVMGSNLVMVGVGPAWGIAVFGGAAGVLGRQWLARARERGLWHRLLRHGPVADQVLSAETAQRGRPARTPDPAAR